MSESTLTSKGQTKIPKKIREHLRLKAGDRLDFVIESDGRVTLRPVTIDVTQLKGLLASRYRGPAISVEEMNRGIQEYVAKKHRARS
ncbi:MAG: AbrB/MazE/SpoVT family DNA-binding domain-containing protein [Burkholderiales bacterium]